MPTASQWDDALPQFDAAVTARLRERGGLDQQAFLEGDNIVANAAHRFEKIGIRLTVSLFEFVGRNAEGLGRQISFVEFPAILEHRFQPAILHVPANALDDLLGR